MPLAVLASASTTAMPWRTAVSAGFRNGDSAQPIMRGLREPATQPGR